MGLPTITVEVAFTTAPAATPTWTDISSYVRGLSTNRGRQHELDRPGAGTAQIVLDNRDQRFDPNNTSSPYNAQAWLDLPGSTGDNATVPDAASLDITGDLDLRCKVSLDDWTPAVQNVLISKYGGNPGRQYAMRIGTDGKIRLHFSENGSTNILRESTVAVPASDGETIWVRATLDADNGASGHDCEFFTSSDDGATWDQLGTTVTNASTVTLNTSTTTLSIGEDSTAAFGPTAGRIFVAQVYDGIDGTLVLNADFRTQATDASSFTDATGSHTVTVNGNASIDRDAADSGNVDWLLPMRRVRIRATWSAVTYDLFSGYVESWPQSYAGPSDAYVTLSCVDGFKVLNLQQISETYAEELSGTRIGNVLDDAGWPAADRDIDTGQSTIAADTITDSALSHIADVEQAELGLFFMAGDGDATFVDRHAFVQATLDTANDTWVDADSGAGNLYADVTVLYDDTDIWNDIRVSRDGGGSQTVTDATSITRYFTRTLTSHQNLIVSSDDVLTDHANALLTRYSEPALRIVNMTVLPQADDSWANLLSYDLATKVRVKRDPPGAGDTITQDSWIEGISHRVRPGEWVTVLNLSPVDRTTDYWVLGTSELGTSTRLGF